MSLHERSNQVPVALTIAGSDSGGGAGVQTDLKTFAMFQVHGTSIVTCITAQNPSGVRAVQAVSAKLIQEQFLALEDGLRPNAVKTGMLYSSAILQSVLQGLNRLRPAFYVLDPVMVATSGAILLKSSAVSLVQTKLIPMAQLVTPNIAEAEVLLGHAIQHPDQASLAARQLYERYGVPFLVKGGHLPHHDKCVDWLYDGSDLRYFESTYLPGKETHGTGCTYAAAITASLALGADMIQAIRQSKTFIAHSIEMSYQSGAYRSLNLWHGKR